MIPGIFCGGRLFTIFSFSHCLACLIAPCVSALARGLFCSSNCKGKDYLALLVLEMGLKPSEKNSLPWFHTHPAHSLSLLVSSVTPNVLLTTWSQVGNCYMLPTIRAVGLSKQYSALDNYHVICNIISHEMHKDQCWSFPIDSSLLQTYLLIQ